MIITAKTYLRINLEATFFKESLHQCLEPADETSGAEPNLTITLLGENAVDQLATTLAKLARLGNK